MDKPNKEYDFEKRTLAFSKEVRGFCRSIRSSLNLSDVDQVIRSSGSVGANYIEAREALSKKDFIHRLRISRKEAKETVYWLRLLVPPAGFEEKRQELVQESTELMMILSAMIRTSEGQS
jgi:four helix bundle protein